MTLQDFPRRPQPTACVACWRGHLDYAWLDSAEGNEFVLKIAGHELRGKVAGTGTWDDFRQADIGELDLPASSRME